MVGYLLRVSAFLNTYTVSSIMSRCLNPLDALSRFPLWVGVIMISILQIMKMDAWRSSEEQAAGTWPPAQALQSPCGTEDVLLLVRNVPSKRFWKVRVTPPEQSSPLSSLLLGGSRGLLIFTTPKCSVMETQGRRTLPLRLGVLRAGWAEGKHSTSTASSSSFLCKCACDGWAQKAWAPALQHSEPKKL